MKKQYYSINKLDEQLEEYLDHDDGFYVELGANNGVAQSNTCYFERSRNWRGVLIEPVLHNYFACKANRSPRNAFFCNACVSFDYKEEFVPTVYANLMTTTIGTESVVTSPVEYAVKGSQFLAPFEEVVIFGAKARTLNSILLEAGAPEKIDLLSLDVEGAEMEVLKGIDFDAFSFRYICVEHKDIKTMRRFLESKGYKLIKHLGQNDYLFSLKE